MTMAFIEATNYQGMCYGRTDSNWKVDLSQAQDHIISGKRIYCAPGQTIAAGASACTPCGADLNTCAGSGWVKILKYQNMYLPQAAASNIAKINEAASAGFAKRKDDDINSIAADAQGYYYYMLEEEGAAAASQPIIFGRTKKSFSDTKQSFGWQEGFTTTNPTFHWCTNSSLASCTESDWQAAYPAVFLDTYNFTGAALTRWFMDYKTGRNCYFAHDDKRCFSAESVPGRDRQNVNIYKWKD